MHCIVGRPTYWISKRAGCSDKSEIQSMTTTLRSLENECELVTDAYIRKHAIPFETSWRRYEKLFHHLYCFSCCYWGCHGKEHVFEHLAGKTVTHGSVATRAMFHGYYDEGLALIRNIGEIANLVNLFWSDPDKIRQWIDSDGKTRRTKFGPSRVRKMLENNKKMIPFEENHYRFLCETAVHPVPHVSPNTYGKSGQPVLGLIFQEKGFQLTFWNLLWATSAVCGPIAKMALLERSRAEKLVELTIPVFEAAYEHGVLFPQNKSQVVN